MTLAGGEQCDVLTTDDRLNKYGALRLPAQPLSNVRVEPVAVLTGHKDRVWCVAWCPTANVLASCSGDTTVKLWGFCKRGSEDISTGTSSTGKVWGCIGTLEGEHSRTVRHISWSPSGEYLACASFDHTATVWRRSSPDGFEFEVEGVLDGHESEVKCVQWATDRTLATCSRDRTVWVWDRIDEGEYECGGVLAGHSQDVKHCIWHLPLTEGEQPMVLSCGYDDTIKVWSDTHRQDDWHCVQTMTKHSGTVWTLAFQRLELSMDDMRSASAVPQPLLCSCSDDLSVVFWSRNADGKYQSLATFSGFCERSIYSVDWAPAGTPIVACGSGDNSVSLLGLSMDSDGVHVATLAHLPAAHEADVNTVSFSCLGTPFSNEGPCDGPGVLLATGGDDNTIRIWRVTASLAT